MSEMQVAIETFARGVAFTRSFTHPCEAERVGPLWVLRDAPRKRGEYRTEEWIAYAASPKEVDRLVRAKTRGRYAICAIHGIDEPDDELRDGYRSLRYRLRTTEPLMLHDLQQIPQCTSPARIDRVMTGELADQLARTARTRQILPEHLTEEAPLRQYVAFVGGQLVGYVRSIVAGEASWCSNMYVLPEFRRRGIARAMLCRMLNDDREYGARCAVLLASHVGARLYPVVGYRQLGTLLLYSPAKSGSPAARI